MVIRKKDLVEDSVFSIKIGEHGYVLAQLRDDCRMDVFDNLRQEDIWDGEDLNKASILFTLVVAEHRLLKLFNSEVTTIVKPNTRPRVLIGLSYGEIRDSTKMPGLRLIKYDPVYDPSNIEVLIPALEPENPLHKDYIYSYEDIGMQGKPEVIRNRIITYYETGVNWDKSNELLYPELSPPPKGYVKVSFTS